MCGRDGHAAQDCKFNQPKGKAQGKSKAKNAQLDKNTPAKFEDDCRHSGKKGHEDAGVSADFMMMRTAQMTDMKRGF